VWQGCARAKEGWSPCGLVYAIDRDLLTSVYEETLPLRAQAHKPEQVETRRALIPLPAP
jgi:hypothetical protein